MLPYVYHIPSKNSDIAPFMGHKCPFMYNLCHINVDVYVYLYTIYVSWMEYIYIHFYLRYATVYVAIYVSYMWHICYNICDPIFMSPFMAHMWNIR